MLPDLASRHPLVGENRDRGQAPRWTPSSHAGESDGLDEMGNLL